MAEECDGRHVRRLEIEGVKPIDNAGDLLRRVPYRGKIWIHAGLRFARFDRRKIERRGIVVPLREVLHRGEIIAVATLHDIVRYSPGATPSE